MKLEQNASKASEDIWIEKYRAALDLSPPEASRYLRVREFLTGIYNKIVARVTQPKTEVPAPKTKKTQIAATSTARSVRTGSKKLRHSITSGKKSAQGVDRLPSRSKSSRASNS
jgi:hypothetical protein